MVTTKDDIAPASDGQPIRTGEDYIESLRGRNLKVYLFGERVDEPVDHPVIRPSVNAVAETYDLAVRNPELGHRDLAIDRQAHQSLPAHRREPGRSRHAEQDAATARAADGHLLPALRRHGRTELAALCDLRDRRGTRHAATTRASSNSSRWRSSAVIVIGGAMTDVKGDRSKAPHEQDDPDLFVQGVEANGGGCLYQRAPKAHQTGCINSHWMVVMPTLRLGPADREYAIIGAIPVEADGITYIYGRQSCDTRAMEGGDIDFGNAKFAGQEAMVIFDDVFIPRNHIFMDGEYDFAAMLVERFTCYHRRSYVCKSGVGDALIGAAATIADYNGVEKASHIRDKLVEMTHLNETIYSTGIASSYQASKK